jgi:hypothetical protein
MEENKSPDFIMLIKSDAIEAEDKLSIYSKINESFDSVLIVFINGGDNVELYQKEEIYKKVF